MQLIKETTPALSRWSVSRFGLMEYTEHPMDRIGRNAIGLLMLPLFFAAGFALVIILSTGSFYQWLKRS